MNRHMLACALVASIAIASSLSAAPTQSANDEWEKSPDRSTANALADSVGINVHLHYTDSTYVREYARFRTLLLASGIRHIRDGLIDTTWQPYYDRLRELGRDGIFSDLISSVQQSPEMIAAYSQRVPGSIESIEGPNEPDLQRASTSASDVTTFMRKLHATLRRSASVPIIAPSLTSEAAHVDVGDISSDVDRGNMHDYFGGRNPGTPGWGDTDLFGRYGSLAYNLALAHRVAGSKPVIATETGYTDDSQSPTSVPDAIAARYVIRTIFEHWNAGVERTYFYEFLDSGTQSDSGFGFVDVAMKPKPAYLAVKSLLNYLRAPETAMPLALHYRLRDGHDVHQTIVRRGNGVWVFALWLEVTDWDPRSKLLVEVDPREVLLRFKERPSGIRVATFIEPGALGAWQDRGARSSITLKIGSAVTLVEVLPARHRARAARG